MDLKFTRPILMGTTSVEAVEGEVGEICARCHRYPRLTPGEEDRVEWDRAPVPTGLRERQDVKSLGSSPAARHDISGAFSREMVVVLGKGKLVLQPRAGVRIQVFLDGSAEILR